MRFRATITFEYEVDNEHLSEAYGTVDPVEMAKVDMDQAQSDLGLFIELVAEHGDYEVRIDPVPEYSLPIGERVIVTYNDPARSEREGTLERVTWSATGHLAGVRFDDGTFLETGRPLKAVK